MAFVFFLPWYTCTLLMPFRWIVLLAHVLHITEFLEQLKLIQDMLYSARFSRALTLLVIEHWFFQDSCTSTSNLNGVHHANLMVLQHLCVRINWFFGDIENICGNPNKTHCAVYFKIFSENFVCKARFSWKINWRWNHILCILVFIWKIKLFNLTFLIVIDLILFHKLMWIHDAWNAHYMGVNQCIVNTSKSWIRGKDFWFRLELIRFYLITAAERKPQQKVQVSFHTLYIFLSIKRLWLFSSQSEFWFVIMVFECNCAEG